MHGFGILVDVTLATELAPVSFSGVLHDDFEGTGCCGSAFSGDDEAGDLLLKEPLDAAEAGSVSSCSAKGDVNDLGGHCVFGFGCLGFRCC